LEQYYHSRDLNIFWKLYGGGYFHRDDIDKVVGEVGEGISGIEASLDTQYILSTGNNINAFFFFISGRHEQQEPFLQWLIDLSDTENAPLVNSASYSDKERTVDPDYMTRINTEFMKAGVRGLTLLFASGDDGAGCHNNTHFEPQFPSSSPYITTIGGTAFIKPFGIVEEQGYDISGGGFSNFFEMPDYQKELIAEYFKVTDPDKVNSLFRSRLFSFSSPY
jgi:tripeptidyl-peptidase-1